MTANEKNILLIVVVVLIIWALSKLANKKKDPEMPYILKVPFLQKYDMNVINAIAELGLYPVPKTRIADFVKPIVRKVRFISPIASRSIDFLILDPDNNFSIVACIVYTTSANKDFTRKLCEKVGIPCIVTPPRVSHREITEQIDAVISDKQAPEPTKSKQ